ncbi:hypothetical protein HDU83_007998 [Entophlyctis luteolus]|nr:hypothetical protein HDU83_007998 [Entophlyctis luteolus]
MSATIRDDIVLAAREKDMGNAALHRGSLQDAVREYSKAIARLRPVAEPDDVGSSSTDSDSESARAITPSHRPQSASPGPMAAGLREWMASFSFLGGGGSGASRRQRRVSTPSGVHVNPPSPIVPPSTVNNSSHSTATLGGDSAGKDITNLLAQLHSNRALAYTRLGDFDRAWVDANAVIRLRSDWVKGYYRRAEVFARLHKYTHALQDYEKSLSLEPANPQIQERIERMKVHVEDASLGIICHQISVARGDVCASRSILSPVQNQIFEFAGQMRNLIYFVGCAKTREVVVVDACWDIDGILAIAESQKYKIVGAIVTHHHVDHAGGLPPPPFDKYGIRVAGLEKLLARLKNIPAYVNPADIPPLLAGNPGFPNARLIATRDGQTLQLGEKVILEFMHTPGHTAGSQCIAVTSSAVNAPVSSDSGEHRLRRRELLLSGDTLFAGACGRCDFEDSSPTRLVESLKKIGARGRDCVVLPGHDYGAEWTTVGKEERAGGMLRSERFQELTMRSQTRL